MLLGIDVGGTFTDAVLIAAGQIVAQAKRPTRHEDLMSSILAVMDEVLANIDIKQVQRVALSTTIVTNTLVEGRTEPVTLITIPGPGLEIAPFVPTKPYILAGYTDHRGREVAQPTDKELEALCHKVKASTVFAISGKFAVRNPQQEQRVAKYLAQSVKVEHISMGAELSGSLNFVRRTNSAYFNAAAWRPFSSFAAAIEQALRQRNISAPVYILKADGGTLPLAAAIEQPVETIFTGPAASVLGIMAMHSMRGQVVSLDIGGTTTDIALWQEGVPLFAQGGAKVRSYNTAVRAFWLRSVGIGGDSFVRREQGRLRIGPMRKGPAMALGGEAPTVSDAMITLGVAHFGDKERARAAMAAVSGGSEAPETTAAAVLETAAAGIKQAVEEMIDTHAAAPVYKVDDIVHSQRFVPQTVVGVGGAARGLVPLVAHIMGTDYQVPDGHMVANAVGAAVARPTLEVTVRADTAQGYYTVAELGRKERLSSRRMTIAELQELAADSLHRRAQLAGVEVNEAEIVQQEEFNVVRGFMTTGKIMTCRMQIKPGVLMTVTGREGAL